jgi:hypothetical protein
VLALWDGATHREQRYAALALVRGREAAPYQDLGRSSSTAISS